MKKEIKLFDGGIITLLDGEVWLTIDDIARLYKRDKKTISLYIKNILIEEAFLTNVTKFIPQGKKEVCYYNLDVILSVGYRVKSENGILFRKYANTIIKEALLKD